MHSRPFTGLKSLTRTVWMEDQESPETREWIDAQNRYTHSLLDDLPAREPIRKRLTQLMQVDRLGIPTGTGGAPISGHFSYCAMRTFVYEKQYFEKLDYLKLAAKSEVLELFLLLLLH